jgi:peptidylprolyl isomerase
MRRRARGSWPLLVTLAASATQAQAPAAVAPPTASQQQAPPRTVSEILAATSPSDWRAPDPENTLYVQLPQGRVVIELAPAFAPLHAGNLRTLVRQRYFDGLAIIRSQDNFVVQWGDPDNQRPLGAAKDKLAPEFTVAAAANLPFEPLPDRDGYAPEVGFSQGFPAARDPARGEAWLAHCYGMVGAGRGNEPESGNGTELYVVTGHAPRQLDRNIALVGRVLKGMELLATLPRGTGPLGFYEKPELYLPITNVRLAADVPVAERERLEILRTDTASFRAVVEARRNRRDGWYVVPAGYVDVCNVPIATRPPP